MKTKLLIPLTLIFTDVSAQTDTVEIAVDDTIVKMAVANPLLTLQSAASCFLSTTPNLKLEARLEHCILKMKFINEGKGKIEIPNLLHLTPDTAYGYKILSEKFIHATNDMLIFSMYDEIIGNRKYLLEKEGIEISDASDSVQVKIKIPGRTLPLKKQMIQTISLPEMHCSKNYKYLRIFFNNKLIAACSIQTDQFDSTINTRTITQNVNPIMQIVCGVPEPIITVMKSKEQSLADSLRNKILSDTSKYSWTDLIHSSVGTLNSRSYSPLFRINGRYEYLLDIIDGNGVISFANEFLQHENIKAIDVLDESDATAIFGSKGKNGAVFIKTKKKKPNYFVAGVKKGSKRKDNFNQYQSGDIKISY